MKEFRHTKKNLIARNDLLVINNKIFKVFRVIMITSFMTLFFPNIFNLIKGFFE